MDRAQHPAPRELLPSRLSCCTCWLSSHVCLQELSDQQLKQMLLAYMVLIMKGRAMKQDDLDTACEVCASVRRLAGAASTA